MTTTTEKNRVVPKIELSITKSAFLEMMKYAKLFAPDECSGVGLMERKDYTDNSIKLEVQEVFLPNQYNTPTRTDIPEGEMHKLMYELLHKGLDTGLLKFHWHSHVDMSVFHSGTDDSNYDDMQSGDYGVSLVVNNRFDLLASVHIYKPFRVDILNIEVAIPDGLGPTDLENLPEALHKKVMDNYERVKVEEEKLRKSSTVIRTNSGYTGTGYYTGTKYGYQRGYGSVWSDPDFLAVLHAAEEEGLMVLIKDIAGDVEGYINPRTGEIYSLESFMDYTPYMRKKAKKALKAWKKSGRSSEPISLVQEEDDLDDGCYYHNDLY